MTNKYQFLIHVDSNTIGQSNTKSGHFYREYRMLDNNGNILSQEYFGKNFDLEDNLIVVDTPIFDYPLIERNAELATRERDVTVTINLTEEQFNKGLNYALVKAQNPTNYKVLNDNCITDLQDDYRVITGTDDFFTSAFTSEQLANSGIAGTYAERIYNTGMGSVDRMWQNTKSDYESLVDSWIEIGFKSESDRATLMQNGENYFKSYHKQRLGYDDIEFKVNEKGELEITTHGAPSEDLNNKQKLDAISYAIKENTGPYIIQSGDTLSQIAISNNTTVERLLELNPDISDPNAIIAGNNLILDESQNSNKAIINNENYDLLSEKDTILLANSGMIATDAIYVNSEGDAVSEYDALFKVTDDEGNEIAILKEGTKVQAKDGIAYEIKSLINQTEAGIKSISKFAFDQTTKFAQGYQQYLASHINDILSDFAMRISRGESMEDAMKDVAEAWGVKALVGNLGVDSAVGSLVGNFTDNQAVSNGAKAGVAHFLSTILIAELRSDGLDSKQYTEEAVKAAAIAYSQTLPSPVPIGVVIAITDAAITAIDDGPDFNSQGWQDYATTTVAAVGTAYLALQMGAIGMEIGIAIGTAIFPGVGTVIGAFVGAVVGALIGATLYMPLKNWGETTFDAAEELYDAIEDTMIKMDFSGENLEENAKQAIKAVEDIAKAYFIDLPTDIAVGILNLFTGGNFYSGQTYGANEAGSPGELLNQLYRITQKADGSGLEIVGVSIEGVTLKASQSGIDDIYGSVASDVLVGNDQNNIIIGSTGSENGADNDMIEGKGGDDILLGKEGHDHIDGGDGNDHIDGGTGNDRLIAGAGDDIVIGGDGDDIIEGNDGNDQIDAGAGDDIIDGGAGDDIIVSGSGNDQILAGDGDDAIFSEAGDDLIKAGAGNDTIESGDGNDEIYGQDGNDNINSGLGDDTIFAGSGVDVINAGLGNDLIDAGADDDLVLAGIGNDIIYGNLGNDDLHGEIGNDYIMGGIGDDEITGGEGDDILEGNVGNDILDGGKGDDLFIHNLGDGNTQINDESGTDIIRIFGVSNQNNLQFVQNGDDLEITFIDDNGSDLTSDKITIKDQFLNIAETKVEYLRIDNNTQIDLTSLTFDANQNPTYNISAYSDAIDSAELTQKYQNILEDSDNEVIYNASSSWYHDNYDTNVLSQEIDYEKYNEVQIRSYKAKRSSFGGHYMVYYKYYEHNLGGTFGSDKIVGSWWNENIWGGAGNDYLYGNDGDDTIFGGDDHDLIYLGSGNDNGYGEDGFDKIYGGEGNDTIEGNADNDTLYGEAGNDVIMGRSGDDLAFGGKGNDFIKGGTGHDILFGGDDSDNLEGEEGNDYLLGEDGDDIISGGEGNDTIIGGNGNDILNGNNGNDFIKGGNGLDIIDGGDGDDIINAGAGNDMILDSKGNDQITLGDGKDIFMITTTNGGTKTITDFNKNEDRIILKDITTTFATLIANNQITQEGNNVRFTHNNYNLILQNTQVADITADNFITSIIGDELDNILNGDEYANAIFGLDGNDILNGNGGNDLLWGGNGSDVLNGNAGDDILFYNVDGYWKGNVASTGKWSFIHSTSSTINADSQESADIGNHTASQDLFDGGDGNDILIMSEQDDVILLDSALTRFQTFNDISYLENNDNGFQGTPIDIETIYAFGGDDIINLTSNINTYGDIKIYGDSGNDTIWTNIGNDTIFGGTGNDDIQSGAGDDKIYGGTDNDTIQAGTGNDTVYGDSGDDTIHGQDGDDKLYGGSGNDNIYGEEGNDILQGNTGDDYLDGDIGNDTYIFNKGDGNDRIHDSGSSDVADKIIFGAGITAGNLILRKAGNDLKIFFDDISTDSITVISQYYYDGDSRDEAQRHRIETLEFSDGSAIDLSTGANVEFSYTDNSETIYGSRHTNDTIQGNGGNDTIYGYQGDDTLHGGRGNDTLYGEQGDDTYIFTKGDGQDIVRDAIHYNVNGNDKIKLGEGISKDDLIFIRSSDHLIINFRNNPSDQLTIQYHFYAPNEAHVIETIEFNDGSTLNIAEELTLTGTDNSETIYGGARTNDAIYAQGGNDTIHAYNGDDVVYGGEGNDTIYGYSGDDTLAGQSGNDYLQGDTGNDTYIFNTGDGNDTFYDRDTADANDKIVFGEGITKDSIILKRDGHHLIVKFKNNDTDSIKIFSQYQYDGDSNSNNQHHRIETLEFEDGSILDLTTGADVEFNYTEASEHGHGSNHTDDTIFGHGGNDTLFGHDGDDKLYGGSGIDTLYGDHGNDVLSGGTGADRIYGAWGNDTYLFNKGDGHDWFHDDQAADASDKILFGEGITKDDLILRRVGNDLKIFFKYSSGDSITVAAQFHYDGDTREEVQHHRIETLEFEDGSILDLTTGADVEFEYTNNSESIQGSNHTDDIIYAYDGNDTISTYNGDDTIYGGTGVDVIYAGGGDDILAAGTGNDVTVHGAQGNDTYIFNIGDGHDQFYDDNYNIGADGTDDKIVFGAGISKDDIILRREGVHLKIRFKDSTTDSIQIAHQFHYDGDGRESHQRHRIETLEFEDGSILDLTTGADVTFEYDDNSQTIYGANHTNDTIYAQGGNDTIHAYNGDDVVYGGEGNDTIHGYGGSDTLSGESGADYLLGSTGNDTYIFNLGDGNDRFYDNDSADANDRILFGEGITKEDLILRRDGTHLRITFKNNPNDSVWVEHHFYYDGDAREEVQHHRIETLEFEDGSILDLTTGADVEFNYTEASEHGHGANHTDDTIFGHGGNDTLFGHDGDDKLYGGSGIDTLYGDHGNDVLSGGTGADRIYGAWGNDTYLFNKGDGHDWFHDDQAADASDKILFGEGITKDDLILRRVGNDLKIFFKYSSGDSITVAAQFHYDGDTREEVQHHRIETLEFEDGSILDLTTGADVEFEYTNNSESIQGSNHTDDIIYAYDGNDTISTYNGDDTIYGGTGVDVIYAGGGDDILAAGTGNDVTVHGAQGNDTYIFNIGDGHDQFYDDNYNIGADGTDDKIVFGAGISKDDIILRREGVHLKIRFKDSTTDSIQIAHQFHYDGDGRESHQRHRIETLEFEDGSILDLTTGADVTFEYDDNSQTIYGANHTNDTIYAQGGNDTIHAYNGDDVVYGGEGNDTIHGYGGSDTLSGESGADYLLGSTGNDTYIFNLGDGNDRFYDNDSADANDRILFGEGITKEDLILRRDGTHLRITFKNNPNDSVWVEHHFYYDGDAREEVQHHRIETLEFSDGSILDLSTGADVEFSCTDSSETIYGSRHTNDTIQGNGGNDTIYGYQGNDTIHGGKGNDTLYGEQGNDTYIFNIGDGKDTIQDAIHYNINDNDKIKLGEGISQDDLIFLRSSDHLLINFKNNPEDQITIKYHFYAPNEAHVIETVKFYDGSTLNIAEELILTGADSSETIYGGDRTDDTIYAQGGNDTIHAYNGDDVVYGGEGNDTIYGNNGDDVLQGDYGNDALSGNMGNDTYVFNLGDGTDIIDDNSNATYNYDASKFNYGNYYYYNRDVQNARMDAWVHYVYYGQHERRVYNGYGDSSYDTLEFGEGITQDNLTFFRNGNNLIISFNNSENDQITIKSQFTQNSAGHIFNYSYMLEEIKFFDGSILDIRDISLSGTDNSETIYGLNDTNDNIYAQGGNDTIHAYNGDDVVYGGAGNDAIYGGNGDDTLAGGVGDDYLYGESGNDTASYKDASGSVNVNLTTNKSSGADGNDVLNNIENIEGSSYGDTLTGNTLANKIHGGDGNDSIYGGAGDDIIDAGAGDDYILGESGADIINGGDGIDSISHWNSKSAIEADLINGGTLGDALGDTYISIENLYGSAFNDVLKGDEGANDLRGGEGDDVIYGRGGDDKIKGDIGNDTVYGGGGNDLIEGFSGDDIMYGDDGDDLIFGHFGDDTIYGGDGNDELYGNHWQAGQDGSDTIYGGLGDDLIRGYNFGNHKLYGEEGNDNIGGGKDSDEVYGGEGDDKLYGFEGSDVVEGGVGNDSLYGNDGDDYLYGGVGDDYLEGGLGADYLDAGAGGWDIISYTDSAESVSINLTTNINKGGTAEGDTIINSERIWLSRSNDQAIGDEKSNFIYGNNGDDALYGMGGDDKLYGENGDDNLYGDSGKDTLDGGNGNDTLTGGTGNDTLIGKDGSDTYIFNIGDGHDIIEDGDFTYDNPTEIDKIKFGSGIALSDLIIRKKVEENAQHIAIEFKDSPDDSITLKYQLSPNQIDWAQVNKIELLKFDDGSVFDMRTMALSETDSNVYETPVTNGLIFGSSRTGNLQFDQLDNFVTDAFTIKTSFKTENNVGALFSYASTSIDNDLTLFNTSNLAVGISKNSSGVHTFANTGLNFNDGKVHNLTVSWESQTGDLLIYDDETLIYSANLAKDQLITQGGTLSIGQEQDAIGGGFDPNQAFQGTVYDVKVYNKALAPEQTFNNNQDLILDANLQEINGHSKIITDTASNYQGNMLGDVSWMFSTIEGTGQAETLKGGRGDDVIYGDFKESILTDDNVIAYYDFDNDDLGVDSSDNGYDGLVYGAQIKSGVKGNAAYFNGNDKITVDTLKNYDWGDKLSISLWMLRDSNDGNFQGIVNNGYYDNSSWEIRMGRDNGGTVIGGGFVTSQADGTWDHHNLTASLNQWHHIAMTYDGSESRYYIDGQLVSTDTTDQGSILIKDNPLTIGQAGFGSNVEFFKGYIDELSIHNDVLSESEVRSLSNVNSEGSRNDHIEGGDGNDEIYGGQGDDHIDGGNGNDHIEGNQGKDTLNGGTGNDNYIFNLGDGNDTIKDDNNATYLGKDISGFNSETYYKYNKDVKDASVDAWHHYSIWGINEKRVYSEYDQSNSYDTLKLGEGINKEDLIFTRENHSNNLVISFKNNINDQITIENQFRGSTGKGDMLNYSYMIENIQFHDNTILDLRNITLSGTQNNDLIYGLNDNDDIIHGNDGDDKISGGTGADIIDGGEGFDTLMYNSSKEAININLQNQTFQGGDAQSDTVINIESFWGSAFNDTMIGSNNSDNLHGSGGDDLIQGNGGNDYLVGNHGNDTIEGGDGNDSLYGQSDNDILRGGAGNDGLYGGDGDDLLEGGEGNDYLKGEAGADIINGGEGIDTAEYWGANQSLENNQGIIVDLRTGEAFGGDAQGDTLIDIENIYATSGDDIIYGNEQVNRLVGKEGNDEIYGYDGNDTLEGREGDDTIYGGNGNDYISGGTGNDAIDGGEGFDTLMYNASSQAININLLNQTFSGGEAENDTVLNIESFWGSGHNDIMIGSNNNDNLHGSGGDDLIQGNGGNDHLVGNHGNDTIEGGDGNDSLYGQSDNDILRGGAGNDGLYGGDGDDLLEGGEGNDYLKGEAGADIINGGEGIDAAEYWGANQSLENNQGIIVDLRTGEAFGGDAQGDTLIDIENIYATSGDDIIYGNEQVNRLVGKEGSDEIYGYGGNDTLEGREGDDAIYAGSGNDNVQGGAGNDHIEGNDGDDTLYGNQGDDYIIGQNGNDTIYGGEGADIIGGHDGDDIIHGNEGNDQLWGSAGNDVVYGDGGDDQMWGGSGNDTLQGGDGNDKLYGEDGDDILYGNQGNDNIYGGNGNDTIYGGDGIDYTKGEAGDDTIYAGAGNDGHLYGGAGADYIDGGEGIDQSRYDYSDAAVTVNLETGINIGGHAQGDILVNIENIIGSQFDDHLTGDINNNTLYGQGGSDEIHGGLGNDFLMGGSGPDILDGGEGIDTTSYWTATSRIEADLINGGTVGDAQGDTYISIENLRGSNYDDILKGDNQNNEFYGYSGNDTIYGRAGNDILNGEDGDDTLYGDEGNDRLNGQNGNDTIYGNQGNDNIYGGNGNDTIYGGDGIDYTKGEAGDDTIYAGAGNDGHLYGGAGADYIDGGEGIDQSRYDYSDAAVTVNLETGINIGGHAQGDILVNIENIIGSQFDDHLTGDINNNTLYGQGGSDEIHGGLGNDFLMGGSGPDILDGGEGIDTTSYWTATSRIEADLINGGTVGDAQGDTYISIENLRGSNYDDILKGDNQNNEFYGYSGNDTIYGRAGNDILNGEDGDDTLYGDEGNDRLFGGNGDDTLYGGNGNDTLSGGDGFNKLFGEDGNDTIQGGSGTDYIKGGYGADIIDGGAGWDAAIYNDSNEAVYINLKENIFEGGTAQGDQLSNIESIWGSHASDTIIGSDGNDNLHGQSGNDELYGGKGDDFLRGNNGNNLLDGGEGNDRIEAGTGDDEIHGGSGDDIIISVGGNNQIDGGDNIDTVVYNDNYENYEIVKGSNGQIIITNKSTLKADTLTDVEKAQFNGHEIVLNNAPTANNIALSTNEDNSILISSSELLSQIQAQDIDGDHLSIKIAPDQGVQQTTVKVKVSADLANGGPIFRLIADGQRIGSDITINAIHKNNEWEEHSFSFDSTQSPQRIEVEFTNDANIAGVGDRNMYVSYIDVNGTRITPDANIDYITSIDTRPGQEAMYWGGKLSFDVGSQPELFSHLRSGIATFDENNNLIYNPHDKFLGKDDSVALLVEDGYGEEVRIVVNINPINHTIYGGADNDKLYGEENDDIIYANEGNDELYGKDGNDTLIAGSGNDYLKGGYGADILDGGDGWDVASYNDSNQSVNINLKTNTFEGGTAQGDQLSNIESIWGSHASDTIIGSDGNDNLHGQSGNDELYGGKGDDFLRGNNGNNLLDGGEGNDRIEAGSDNDVVYGGSGNDYILGEAGNDSLTGGMGADTIDGGDGWDTIYYINSQEAVEINLALGTGIGGDASGDTLSNVERIYGSNFNDILIGNERWDNFVAGAGDDTLHGADGNDYLKGESGDDKIYGGNDDDTIDGGAGNDELHGGANNDIIGGGDGSDILYGGDGEDVLIGGAGDDRLYGGTGSDIIDGGDGIDIAQYNSSNAGIIIDLSSSTASGGSAQGDTLTNIENIYGSLHDDHITGDHSNNKLVGSDGNDELSGREGDDELHGQNGSDTLNGGDGNDTLYAGNDNDTINGGLGADSLFGGAGDDSFDYSSLEDSSINASDIINDFEQGSDIIDLSQISEVALSFDSFEFSFEGGNTILKDKDSDFAIELAGVVNLDEGDFNFG